MKIYKDLNNDELVIYTKEVPLGENYKLLVPRSTDAAVEKHVPVVKEENRIVHVTVGEIPHPMTEEHYISHIIIETNIGYYVKLLKPGMEPKTTFKLNDNEKVENVYAYCNLHGLWR